MKIASTVLPGMNPINIFLALPHFSAAPQIAFQLILCHAPIAYHFCDIYMIFSLNIGIKSLFFQLLGIFFLQVNHQPPLPTFLHIFSNSVVMPLGQAAFLVFYEIQCFRICFFRHSFS